MPQPECGRVGFHTASTTQATGTLGKRVRLSGSGCCRVGPDVLNMVRKIFRKSLERLPYPCHRAPHLPISRPSSIRPSSISPLTILYYIRVFKQIVRHLRRALLYSCETVVSRLKLCNTSRLFAWVSRRIDAPCNSAYQSALSPSTSLQRYMHASVRCPAHCRASRSICRGFGAARSLKIF